MNRSILAAALALLAISVSAMSAQTVPRPTHEQFPTGSIEGRVLDSDQSPVAGAMVSVVGRATAAATTDRDGRYAIKALPFGPYILSVHSRGYWQSRSRTVQLNSEKVSPPVIHLARAASDKPAQAPAAAVSTASLAGFGELELAALHSATTAVEAGAGKDKGTVQENPGDSDGSEEVGETSWRLRHLPRSILKDTVTDKVWVAQNPGSSPHGDWFGRSLVTVGPAALFSDLALSGQVNLLTTESFDSADQMFGANGGRSVAYVSVGTRAAGGAWSMQGAMTQGDLASWIVAGSYKSIDAVSHAYDVGLSYSTQRYDGGNAAALNAMRDSARNVGSVYGYDQWTVSPRFVIGYGTAYSRYDYLPQAALWSPRLSVMVPMNGFRLKALASERAVAPGAEEFAPSVTGLWLPPERTFSSLSADGTFRPERTRHVEVSLEKDLAAGVAVSLRGFNQRVDDQLVEMFALDVPGREAAPMGHYYVGTAGDIDARGWGIGMSQEVPGYVRGSIEYTVATAYWLPSSETGPFSRGMRPATLTSENVYDLVTSIEATIPQTATKVYAKYRMNTAFWSAEADRFSQPNANTRFNVRISQSLPFLRFSSADWEMLLDVRNMFRDEDSYASLYDEALAVRAPKRVVGGLRVKF